jgi:MinD superfamily P-loop ATPase
VCVNKWDINPDITVKIKEFARESGLGFAGQVRFDKTITAAQRLEKTIIEFCENGTTDDIRKIWKAVTTQNNKQG